jgi:metal-responsive CopG/Arc/MetJ family transcriptional regulator
MHRQITVRMPDDLLERLERNAKSRRRKRSEVIRMAVERFLEETEETATERPIDTIRDLLGSYESGIPDLGQSHREHLLRRLRRER